MFEVALRPARDARAIVEDKTKTEALEQLAQVVCFIEDAIARGLFSVHVPVEGQLHPMVQRQLRNMAYDVRRSNEAGYLISWRGQ